MDKKIAMFCFCALVAIFVIPTAILAASFDCSKASTKTEKAICADSTLSQLDEDMAAAYSTALKTSDPEAVKKEQLKWLREVVAPCIEDKVCIKKAYENRLRQLESSAIAKATPSTSEGIAGSEAQLCSELSGYFMSGQESKLKDPSRDPTKEERLLIDKEKIALLEWNDYANGVSIVDADNDGKEDVFVWSIQGTGRIVNAELYNIPAKQAGHESNLVLKAELYDLGVLEDPRFIRFKGVNYLVYTETGGQDGITISQIVKAANGKYQQRTLCRTQTIIQPETQCGHPACKRLAQVIRDKNENGPFVVVEWPHKYFAPAGLAVYFPEEGSDGDFDNTNRPTSIWRIGRNEYIYQHMYWALLGQGEDMPKVDPKLRPKSNNRIERRVLPGSQHDRLRRTLAQQSEILSNQLHRPISLPKQGEFFLFKANGNRTYWAWDFGEPPVGEEIHITYTNAKKSDYIGMIRIKSDLALVLCVTDCIRSLDQ